MSNVFDDTFLKMMDNEQEPKDYKGKNGLLYCGRCHTPKESYFAEGKNFMGRDRHPTECDCRRAEREKREKEETEKKHNDEVERLKRNGFTDSSMRDWTFKNDNGNCPICTNLIKMLSFVTVLFFRFSTKEPTEQVKNTSSKGSLISRTIRIKINRNTSFVSLHILLFFSIFPRGGKIYTSNKFFN